MRASSEPDDDTLIARARFRALPADPAEGLFRPGCRLRVVSADPVILLGGGRALLLELAHPVVAIGVAEHSNFRRDPFGRLQRTLAAMTAITFHERGRALAAVRGIERSHARVRGTFDRDVGRYRAGTPYSASDPDARRWVWATLVDTAVAMYRRFVADLPAAAAEDYYADQLAVARLLGLPDALLPPTWPAFEAFFADAIAGDGLAVDARAREIAAAVLRPPGGTANAKLVRLLSTALLPERLRQAFELDWGPDNERRFEALVRSVRGLRRSADPLDGDFDPR